jgi:23S rRNA (uracil1939-C5)-methyltransferase
VTTTQKRRRHSRKPPKRPSPPRLWGKDSLLVDRMSQEGRGIASRDGKIVFVSGALVGEQVRAQCTAVKRDYDEAEFIELLADTIPSPQRVTPPCPIYQDCGGCSSQHWSVTAQQQHKQATLESMLQVIAPLALEPAIVGPAEEFRHRLRLVVTRTADQVYSLGLRQRSSHEVVKLSHCLVANAAVNAMVVALPKMLSSMPELQGLREIEVDADSRNQIGLCCYFAAHPGDKNLRALREALLVEPVCALRVRLSTRRKPNRDTFDDENGPEELSQSQELLAEGELTLQIDRAQDASVVSIGPLKLTYLPGDFTQTNWTINAALVVRALQWLRPSQDEVALDLFAGIGNFSLPLASMVKAVHAIENDSAMTQRIIVNAELNGITNVRAVASNLMTDDLVLPKADIAIVDPPRAGAKAVCEALSRCKVRRIVYVSCHPATLLRDARALYKAGYRLTKAAAVDMFPHTGHSEAIALFERK